MAIGATEIRMITIEMISIEAHLVQLLADVVSGVAERGRPEETTNEVVDKERAVMHGAHTSNDRGEGAHDRHEAGQHNGL